MCIRDRAKGMFNIGKTKELYIFEQLVANLMKVTNQTGTWVPLYVMTKMCIRDRIDGVSADVINEDTNEEITLYGQLEKDSFLFSGRIDNVGKYLSLIHI